MPVPRPPLDAGYGAVSHSSRRRIGSIFTRLFRRKRWTKTISVEEATHWRDALREIYRTTYGLALHPLQTDVRIVPPTSVIDVVQGSGKDDPTTFLGTGYRETARYLSMLHGHGFKVTAMRRMLDFGFGTGRILVHFLPFPIERYGCDVTPEALAWTSRTLGAHATLRLTSLQPPLPFDDDFFDLIVATSVFTHTPYAAQAAWLRELRRILVPGGCILATVQHFAKLPPEFRERGWHETYTDRGIHMRTFLSEAKLAEMWGVSFEVCDTVAYPQGQAQLLAVKR